MLAAGGDHEVLRLVLLQHQPLHLHVVARMAPVAQRIQIAKIKLGFQALGDIAQGARDLACDEGLATARRFVVEQDAAGTEDVVTFAVVHRDPVRVELGHAIRAARVERRLFDLRDGLYLAEHFRGRRLVEADLRIDQADRFQQVERAHAGDLCGGGGLFEAHAHEALRGQVVDLVRLDLLHHRDGGAQVGEVVLDQMQVRVVEHAHFVQAPEVHRAGATVRAMDLVALLKQQFGQVSTVLTRDTRDDCLLHDVFSSSMIDTVLAGRSLLQIRQQTGATFSTRRVAAQRGRAPGPPASLAVG